MSQGNMYSCCTCVKTSRLVPKKVAITFVYVALEDREKKEQH